MSSARSIVRGVPPSVRHFAMISVTPRAVYNRARRLR